MSGQFVIWDITSDELDDIFNIFQGAKWGEVAHREGDKINPNDKTKNPKKFQGWDDINTKVYENGMSWKGFPYPRDTVPPHNYISVQAGNIYTLNANDIDIKSESDLEKIILDKSRTNWFDDLAIVPLSDKFIHSRHCSIELCICKNYIYRNANELVEYSSTRLNKEALEGMCAILNPDISSIVKHDQIKKAFFKQLATGDSVTFEIYSIENHKITKSSDMPQDKKSGAYFHWIAASK